MKYVLLKELAKVDISNVDKKSKTGESVVFLCNYVDVYHNWAITNKCKSTMMEATANASQIKRFSIHKGQVAITKDSETRDDIGISTYIADEVDNTVLGYHCALITPKDSMLNGKYLNIVLNSTYARKYFEANASGSGQRYTLTSEIIENFPVPLPDEKCNQDLFGRLCSDFDSKITNNQAIISNLEAIAKLLYNYWFIQFDFPDENGKPYASSGGEMVWNEELKKKIPANWNVTKFKECIVSINTGLNPRNHFKLNRGGKIKYLTVKNLTTDGTVDFGSCDTIDDDASALIQKRSDVQIGDILFASISPLGRCYIVTETPKDWNINESVFSIRPNYHNMTSNYLYMTFMSELFIKQAEGSSAGSVFKGIRIADLLGLSTVLPPKCILEAFDDQVEKLFEMKTNLLNENQRIIFLRDFLLPMIVSGQLKQLV